jgi:type II secretory pathway pseudopilin PulG
MKEAMRHSRSDSGFALIEAIVAAAVLAMVALAVLSGIDGATRASGRERARSVAASLAEQDQERLRSMQIDTLSKYNAAPRTVPVDGVNYTVTSTTRWVRDDTSTASNCTTGDNKQSDYLYIKSSVTSNVVGVRTAPVTIESIVTPPIKYSSPAGSLAIQVNNRSGVGVPNLGVSIAGPTGATRNTDASGCALFEYIPEGDYDVTATRGGWVDELGNATLTSNDVAVNRGTLVKQTLVYDQAANATLAIKTYTPESTTDVRDSSAAEITTIPAGKPMRQFPATSGLKPTIQATKLFPFTAPYAFWTGNCASESPATYTSTYFNTAGGKALQTDPGGSYVKEIFQPPLRFRVTRDRDGNRVGIDSTNTLTVTATFVPDSTDTGCSDTLTYYPVTRSTLATNKEGWLSLYSNAPAYDPGIPFGQWTICVFDQRRTRRITKNYDARTIAGLPPVTDITPAGATWVSGRC